MIPVSRLLVAAAAACTAAPLAAQTAARPSAQTPALPLRSGSVRFLVLGDAGTGDAPHHEVAQQIVNYGRRFPFTFAILLGDNIYGSERPQDFAKKFERPYKILIESGVEFHAALGNHDDPNQRYYKPFNLGGARYRTFKKGNVRFFILDSNYLDPEQVRWLTKELESSGSDWKIAYFHHPPYSSGGKHGSETALREVIEPIFVKYGVNVVFAGHEHFYERVKPQKGIYYFISGAGGKLRPGDVKKGSPLTEKAFDKDMSFMLVEINGDEMHFQVISRTGETVDSGVITHQRKTAARASN